MVLALVLALVLAGCGSSAESVATLHVTSTTFADGADIPVQFTCDSPEAGAALISPALAWSGAPATAKVMAVVVLDPDAGNFVHWLAANVPAGSGGSGSLAQRASGTDAAGVEGRNSAGKDGWTPPCPPPRDVKHHYVMTVYALSAPLSVEAGFSLSDLRAAMDGKVVAQGMITGLYARAA